MPDHTVRPVIGSARLVIGSARPRRRTAFLVVAVLAALTLLGQVVPASGDATQYGNDLLRSGWFADQTTLTPGLVSGGSFGRMWTTNLTGQIFAQPVVNNGVVVVATEDDNVYGLDETTGAIKWSRNVGVPWNIGDINCADFDNHIGVTATPVIDPATNVAYFTAKTYASGTSGPAAYSMHAVDVATGAERAGFPVAITGTAANDPTASFSATTQLQRPGLLLMDGVIYAAFGGHCDRPDYRGWIFGVSTAGAVTTRWTAEAGQGSNPAAGIWQSGAGLSSDGAGQILFSTGNGVLPAAATPGKTPPPALGQAVVRLSVQPDKSLKATDFFMPYDSAYLNTWDADLGSGAPLVLPSSFGTPAVPRPMAMIGKEGYLYVMNADDLGGYQQGAGGSDAVVNRLGPYGGVWSKPTPWGGDGGYLYVPTASGGQSALGTSGYLRAFKRGVDGQGKPTFSLAGSSSDAFGFGSSPAVVSSVGTTSGSALVWTVWSAAGVGTNAQLRAYDPVPVGNELQLRWSAPIGTASKFNPPVISKNRVIVGIRDGAVMSFGSPVTTPLTGAGVSIPATTVGQSRIGTVTVTASFGLDVTGVSSSSAAFVPGATVPAIPSHLNAGQSLSVPVTFSPTSPSLFSGTLTVQTSAGAVPFALTGTGQSATAVLLADPPSISFGSATIGGTPVTSSINFHNAGAQSLTITSVTAPSAPFSATGLPAPGTTVAAGADVTATVAFAPTAAGLFTSEVEIVTSAGTVDVPMSGTASTPPKLTVSATTVDLGNTYVDQTRVANITVTNTGGSPLLITRSKPPSVNGFTVQGDIPEGTTLAPGASVTGSAAFKPAVVGAASATWELNGNDGAGIRIVTFTGTGVVPPLITSPTAGGWQLNGTAQNVAGPLLSLTPADLAGSGTAFWPYTVPTATFGASFDATIDGGTGGDGMALVFTDPTKGAKPTDIGFGGGGLGFASLPGVAVALDTYQNGTDPSSNFVGIATGGTADTLNWLATSSNIPALRPGTHHVDVRSAGGRLTVAIDGTQVLDAAVTLPAKALVGFTGSSGGRIDRHAVGNVTFTQPRAALTVDPSLSFGPTGTGSSTTKSVTLRNTGQLPLTLSAPTAPTASYALTGTSVAGKVLAPGASVAQAITFTPTATGYVPGSVSFSADDGSGAHVVALTGAGLTSVPAPTAGGWRLNGAATMQGSALELTGLTSNVAGSAYWPTALKTGFLTIDADTTIGGGSGADGMALVFNDATKSGPTSLGGSGGSMGWAPTPGVAIVYDTWQNTGEPSRNFLAIANGSVGGKPTYIATTTAIPDLRQGTHHLSVNATTNHLTVSIDGVSVLSVAVALPASAFVGFTGATGGATDRHQVSNVRILSSGAALTPVPSPSAGTWKLNGVAGFAGAPLILTPARADVAGSSFANTTTAAGHFSVAFDETITAGSGADGMTFTIADASAPAGSLGAGGSGMGYSGISGVALVFDTFRNDGEASDNTLSIATSGFFGQRVTAASTTAIPPLRNATHHVVVTYASGRLVVQMDGATVLDVRVTLPPVARFGFTAATGGLTNVHQVQNVTISG